MCAAAAIDLSRTTVDFSLGQDASLVRCDLSDAEADGTLAAVGSVYVTADDSTGRGIKAADVDAGQDVTLRTGAPTDPKAPPPT